LDPTAIATVSAPKLGAALSYREQPCWIWGGILLRRNSLEAALKQVGMNRAIGADGIPIEVIKLSGGPNLLRTILALCNDALYHESCPSEWKDVNLTALHKGDSTQECTNYRGLSVMAHCGKLLERMILNRLDRLVAYNPGCIPDSQCGFVAGKGTVDALLISRVVTSHAIETNTPLFKCYVDLTKAYDKVNRETMWEILRRLGAPAKLVNLIASLHDGAMASVKTAGCDKGSAFELRTGLKQGSVLSPMLFNIFLGAIVNVTHAQYARSVAGIPAEDCGVQFDYSATCTGEVGKPTGKLIAAHKTYEILYADDCVLLARSEKAMQRMLDIFDCITALYGQQVSIKKTKVMVVDKTRFPLVKKKVKGKKKWIIENPPLFTVRQGRPN